MGPLGLDPPVPPNRSFAPWYARFVRVLIVLGIAGSVVGGAGYAVYHYRDVITAWTCTSFGIGCPASNSPNSKPTNPASPNDPNSWSGVGNPGGSGTTPAATVGIGDRVELVLTLTQDRKRLMETRWTYEIVANGADGQSYIVQQQTQTHGEAPDAGQYAVRLGDATRRRAQTQKLLSEFRGVALTLGSADDTVGPATPPKRSRQMFPIGPLAIPCQATTTKTSFHDTLGKTDLTEDVWVSDEDPLLQLATGGIVRFRQQTRNKSPLPNGTALVSEIDLQMVLSVYRRGGMEAVYDPQHNPPPPRLIDPPQLPKPTKQAPSRRRPR